MFSLKNVAVALTLATAFIAAPAVVNAKPVATAHTHSTKVVAHSHKKTAAKHYTHKKTPVSHYSHKGVKHATTAKHTAKKPATATGWKHHQNV